MTSNSKQKLSDRRTERFIESRARDLKWVLITGNGVHLNQRSTREGITRHLFFQISDEDVRFGCWTTKMSKDHLIAAEKWTSKSKRSKFYSVHCSQGWLQRSTGPGSSSWSDRSINLSTHLFLLHNLWNFTWIIPKSNATLMAHRWRG